MIAVSGITIERKVTSSSTNASPSTNANTNGARDFIVLLKSSVCPATPVVWVVMPGMRPIVAGITLLRSSSSASSDVASTPVPASGI